MSEYTDKANEFLNSCPAEMTIIYAGTTPNNTWNDKEPRDMFSFVIKTQKGTMNGIFWSSIHNTRLRNMTLDDYCKKKYNRRQRDCTNYELNKAKKELTDIKETAKPRPYDILACLQKYDVGSMDDFMHEFGYEIKCVKDMTDFINTYNAVIEEYKNLCRIFTPEQMKKLREIW
jgi:hypothetical protein